MIEVPISMVLVAAPTAASIGSLPPPPGYQIDEKPSSSARFACSTAFSMEEAPPVSPILMCRTYLRARGRRPRQDGRVIFHIARASAWRSALADGHYRQSTVDRTLDEEGFIHASGAQIGRAHV